MYRFLTFFLLSVCIASPYPITAQNTGLPLSYEASRKLLEENNKSLKIADKQVQVTREEAQRINAFWYPVVTATGSYMHLSNKVEVREPLSVVTDPVKDFVHMLLPDDQIISSILDKVGSYSLAFPLLPQDLTTVDAELIWPLFTGGKRIYGTKAGKAAVRLAHSERDQVRAVTQAGLVTSYFALRLGEQVIRVRRETYEAMCQQYQDALQMERAGLINKAERLVIQVAMKESLREYQQSRSQYDVAQQAFKSLLDLSTPDSIVPTTPLFINDTMPSSAYFKSLVTTHNYTLNQLQIQDEIAGYEDKIAKSAYLPEIALIGKQNLFANGIPKSLVPRTMIGVGFTWTLFDGLNREKRIRQVRLGRETLALSREKVADELLTGIESYYSQMQQALQDVSSLNSTLALSRELLRVRQKGFAEGMATSTEVRDARVGYSNVKIAYLLAYYQYDVALMNLLALCGIPESFDQYRNQGTGEEALNH